MNKGNAPRIFSKYFKTVRFKKVWDNQFKAELDRRNDSYKNGTAIMVTAEESKQRIEQIMKSRRSK